MTLKEQFAAKVAEARAALEAGNLEQGRAFKAEAETMKSALVELDDLETMKAGVPAGVMRPPMPVGAAPQTPDVGNTTSKMFEALYVLRFGDEDASMKAIYGDLVGVDHRQQMFEQYEAFKSYLRNGDTMLDANERRLLRRQIFPKSQVLEMIKNGYSVATIKATMVEAQGALGGFAVPANVQEEIISRIPGRTAVRGAGATVVDLMNSNSIDIPRYAGGNVNYVSALRGQWGAETATPSEKNPTLELVTVVADLYTYKVPMSQSIVEDAANLVSLVTADIVSTLSMDEDVAFLVGDGVGKPLGILPGSANTLSLTEVVTGSASALTAAGVKKLKRGVASQYRSSPQAAWVANSATYGLLEVLESSTGSGYVFPDLSEKNVLLAKTAYESEAMADVASNAYPLLFGDMSGYYIVQRAGLTIARFQDSATGINKVEYHVRRRVGGRVAQPWKFAVQKCST